MIIKFNNTDKEVKDGITCYELMQETSVPGGAPAALLWRNGAQVRPDQMKTTVIEEGDSINIIGGFKFGG